MKKISILGSTGKIGRQTLEVVRSYPGEFKVVGLACGSEERMLEKQIDEFGPKIVAVAERDGEEKVCDVARAPEAEMVVVAVVGLAGLAPTLAAIKERKDIALATKEVLVVAGGLVMKEVKKYGVNLIPVDSEHSAIFQCLHSGKAKEIRNVFLTMGKGPIAKMNKKELEKVGVKDVFNRPKWTMGKKIAVDSATCINKAFEVIEARWLFGLAPEQIKVVVHPEYVCHSLVEFVDGSVVTELGSADMRRYIQYALFYPERKETRVASFIDLVGKKLSFEKPPFEKFPCLNLGYEVLEKGGSAMAVMHGADRAAVEAFFEKRLGFTKIYKAISLTLQAHKAVFGSGLKKLVELEKWGYGYTIDLIKKEKL